MSYQEYVYLTFKDLVLILLLFRNAIQERFDCYCYSKCLRSSWYVHFLLFFHLFFFICLFPHKSRVDSWSSSFFSFFFVDYWAFFHRSRLTRTDNAKKKKISKRGNGFRDLVRMVLEYSSIFLPVIGLGRVMKQNNTCINRSGILTLLFFI